MLYEGKRTAREHVRVSSSRLNRRSKISIFGLDPPTTSLSSTFLELVENFQVLCAVTM